MSDQIAAQGGADPDRVKPFLTERAYDAEVQGFRYLADNNLRLSGSSSFDSLRVRRWDPESVEAYLCLDLSTARVVDGAGTDVTPADRVVRQPFEVRFVAVQPGGDVLIDRNTVWTGDNFC